MDTSFDVNTLEGSVQPSYIGLTSNVLSEAKTSNLDVSLNTGVSTRNVPTKVSGRYNKEHWYAVRSTYGREKKAYDYIVQHGGTAFLPTIIVEKEIRGQIKRIEVSRIPNIFFVYGTEDTVKFFVYDNVNLPFLRFYYTHHIGTKGEKLPLIVPDNQIKSLKIICSSEAEVDTFLLQEKVDKFRKGEKVRVKDGNFKGVIGIVARFHGQQRVGLVIDGLLTAITAYIPSAFLERL